MALEQRYIVIKIKDADACLHDDQARQLNHFCKVAEQHRRARGADPLQGLMIEKDWPEYPIVLAMLEARIAGEPMPVFKKVPGPLGMEDYCFCNDSVSLQSVSGGGATEGYLGSVRLKIDGQFVTYKREDEDIPTPVSITGEMLYEAYRDQLRLAGSGAPHWHSLHTRGDHDQHFWRGMAEQLDAVKE